MLDALWRWQPRWSTAYRRERDRLNGLASVPVDQEGLRYHCPLTPAKRDNLALQHINKSLLPWKEFSRPHILHVGVTSHCNLRCPACPTGTDKLGRPREHLDFDIFRRTADDLGDALQFTLFWEWGEPFLHPRLADMVGHVSKRDVLSVISTNGTIRNEPERIDQLVAAQPTVVIVCVDGATQEAYSRYRVDGKLDDVLATIRRLRDAKDRLGVEYPVIEFRSLATRYSVPQMFDLLAMAKDLGADVFSLKSFRPHDYRDADVSGELVPLMADLARYHTARPEDWKQEAGQVATRGPLRCGKPTYAPALHANGELAFCNYAGEPEEIFGHLGKQTFNDLWDSPQARAKRHTFLEKEGTHTCWNCHFRSDHEPTVGYMVPLRPLPDRVSVIKPTTEGDFHRLMEPAVRGYKEQVL